ncbi:imidazole glycerol phosphate synthase subunit HisH [Jeotgalibacillus proteolyticus]|uniref:Imidazole glycerol phosphate synthase subunit HisH n=1 Tax=Jeotgalibacillus proteolyticus TaxID=2082395 RepID=A0A2S5GB95_9BACL|nr:imidazole glycerol phosphate synthase subunit HisH [Jeotgalibacillus proteolyticus]PPA70195.1 imidazole glycerol phosphate synthase subunit HisH [Jeotgalibacillus proteolyticus]
MIGIVDYGMGNLFSVSKALERLEAPYIVSDNKEQLAHAEALILPGVGAFRDAMKLLNETGLASFIVEQAKQGKPVLGICLGMQLLFEESEENGLHTGLGLLKGRAVHFDGKDEKGEAYKVPHMGWNKLEFHRESPLTKDVEGDHVYFVHSYYISGESPEALIASADYFGTVPAVVGKENVFGMQFHPEKSGDLGMSLLGNYTRYVKTMEAIK